MKKKNTKTNSPQNILLNPLLYLYSILILIICNISNKAILDRSLEIRLFSISLLLVILLIIPFLSKKNFLKNADFSLLKRPIIFIYGIFVLLQGISISYAQNTGEAFHEFLKTGSLYVFFLFMMLYVVPQKNSREIFLKVMVIFSLIISITGIIQALNIFSENGFSFNNARYIDGNFSNKNMFSQILFLGFTFSAFSIYFLKKLWKSLSYLAALSSLLVIVVLMTRSVWLGLIISSIISAVVYLGFIRKHLQSQQFSKNQILLFTSVGFGIIVLFGIISLQFDYGQTVKKRIENTFKLSDTSIMSRLEIWGKTMNVVKESPIIGVGSGNWKIEILKYDVVRYRDGWVVPRRAHNDYLTVLTETGIIGLLLYLSIFVFGIVYMMRIIRKSDSLDDKIFSLALGFALIGYMCFSFFSFTKERIETQILINMILAFVVFMSQRKTTEEKASSNKLFLSVLLVIALGFTSITAYSSWKRMQTEIAINKMYQKLNRNHNKASIYPLIQDIRSPFASISPRNTPFLQLKGKFMFALGEDRQEVIQVYNDALKDSPYHVRTILELANIYLDGKDLDNALKYGDLAYQYAPSNEMVILSQAIYIEELGELDSALYYLDQVHPRNLQSSFFPQITRVLKKKAIVLLDKENNQAVKIEIANLANANDGKSIRIIYKRSQNNQTNFEYEFMKEVQKQFTLKYPDYSKQYTSPLLVEYGVIKE
jgi:O-antigen ligase